MHWGGSALAITGVGFVLWRLHAYGSEIEFDRLNGVAWLALAIFALINGLANLMLALAWWNLLGQFGACTTRSWAVRTYGMSQLAKYVPGNIFHLAGRQAIGMAAGVPGWPLAQSTAWELGLIAVAGALFGLLAVPLVWPELPVIVSVGAFGAVSVGLVIALRRLLSPSLGAALIWQIIFLAVSGVVFVGVLALVAPTVVTFSAFPALCGAYVIAWLAGLVTPGAPAGAGVREMVLLFMLKGVIGEGDLLLAVVLGRMATVAGDFFYFLMASFIKLGQRVYE